MSINSQLEAPFLSQSSFNGFYATREVTAPYTGIYDFGEVHIFAIR